MDIEPPPTPTVTSAHRIRTTFLVFLSFNFLYLLCSSGRLRVADEYMVFFQAESLVQRGDTAVPQAVRAGNFFGRVDREGKPRAPYLPAAAVAAVPFYVAGRSIAMQPAVPPAARWYVVMAVTAASSATFAAGVVALYFLLAWRLSERVLVAACASAAVGLSTFLFPYSAYFFSEPLAALMLLTAAALLVLVPADRATPEVRGALVGAVLGACVWIRFTHVLAIPVFALAAWAPERSRRALRAALALGAAATVAAALCLLRNYRIWGDVREWGYPAIGEGGRHLLTFDLPWYRGLYGFLLSPGKSVFLFAPPLLLALLWLPRLREKDRSLFWIAVGLPLVDLLFYMRYTLWEGGYCVGPRYLLPACIVLALPLAPGLARASRGVRRGFVALCAAGLIVQLVSMATSFLEDQRKDSRYYDAEFHYRLDYSPLRSQGELLLAYLTDPKPARAGLGFDRWFVFLGKIGVSRAALQTAVATLVAGWLASSAWLACDLRRIYGLEGPAAARTRSGG